MQVRVFMADIRVSAMTVARFDPSGKLVFVGTSNGNILVFNTRTKSVRRFLLTFLKTCPAKKLMWG
jgi:hypothetical protein